MFVYCYNVTHPEKKILQMDLIWRMPRCFNPVNSFVGYHSSPYHSLVFNQPLNKISLELGTGMHEKRLRQAYIEFVNRGIRDILNNFWESLPLLVFIPFRNAVAQLAESVPCRLTA